MATLTPIRASAALNIDALAERIQGALPGLSENSARKESKKEKAREILERHSAGLETACVMLAELMHSAQNENVKLKANERILQIHEVLDADSDASSGGIQFILGADVNVNQLLVPQR